MGSCNKALGTSRKVYPLPELEGQDGPQPPVHISVYCCLCVLEYGTQVTLWLCCSFVRPVTQRTQWYAQQWC